MATNTFNDTFGSSTTSTSTTLTSNGTTGPYALDFEYATVFDVEVFVDGVLKTRTTDYTFTSATQITFTNAPSNGATILIQRNTVVHALTTLFQDGSVLSASELNNVNKQLLHSIQEVVDDYVKRDGSQTINNSLVFEGSTNDANETTLSITDPTADRTITLPDITGTVITTGDTETVSNQMIAGDAVTNAKIADDSIDSEHYVDGSIDNAHLANDAVNGNKIADDSINSEHYVDGSIDTQHIAADQITNALIADDQIDSEHYVDGSIDRQHLEADIIDGTKLADNAVNSEHIQANAVTDSEIATGTLDNRYFTETELTGGALDGRYYTETEAEALFLRQDSSETIASGQTWSNSDAFVATTAAINARIIDLVNDVGGFTVIANENSFPNTNPQATTNQSAILSIGAVTTTLTPSSGTITLPNGRLNNGQVLITGVPSAIPQGFGLLVESTSTDHTYTFHRLVPKATEVTTVASNITNIVAAGANVADINNFADIYQISSNAPTQRADGSALQDGDLWFDNSNDNLLVYTGSSFSIITPSQSVLNDIAIVSGAITFTEDFGLITNPVTTGSSNGSLEIVADTLEDEITFIVTAATGKFIIDGVDKPALTLHKGWTYTFDVSDASNATHPLRFQSGGNPYSTNVTVTGTQGQAGAKVVIKIPESQPTSFQYYCTNHSGMGNTITVVEDPIKQVADVADDLDTIVQGNNLTNLSTVATSIANVNTVGNNISNVNSFASVYTISANAPSNPASGDLWYDTSTNQLKNYNGSAWLAITASSGIQNVVDDATPQLGGALDGQNNNLTNIGTIDGANLQLDFGTI